MELKALKVELFKRNITQFELSKRLNIAHSTVNKKLNRKIEFSDGEKLEIVKLLDLSQCDEIIEIFLPKIFLLFQLNKHPTTQRSIRQCTRQSTRKLSCKH